MGLNGPLSMGSVTSLEARIGPKATPRELKRRIQEQDWYKEFADQENARARSRIRQEFGSPGIEPPLQAKILFLCSALYQAPRYRSQRPAPRVALPSRGPAARCPASGFGVGPGVEHFPIFAQPNSRRGCGKQRGSLPARSVCPCLPVFAEFQEPGVCQGEGAFPPVSPRLSATYHVGEDSLGHCQCVAGHR